MLVIPLVSYTTSGNQLKPIFLFFFWGRKRSSVIKTLDSSPPCSAHQASEPSWTPYCVSCNLMLVSLHLGQVCHTEHDSWAWEVWEESGWICPSWPAEAKCFAESVRSENAGTQEFWRENKLLSKISDLSNSKTLWVNLNCWQSCTKATEVKMLIANVTH